jgi:hypothetical protein
MRLALAMGRTVRELEESLDADEWADWIKFQELYDLPDGFIVAGRVCAKIDHALGGKAKAADFAPYYEVPVVHRGVDPSVIEFGKFVRANGVQKQKSR